MIRGKQSNDSFFSFKIKCTRIKLNLMKIHEYEIITALKVIKI